TCYVKGAFPCLAAVNMTVYVDPGALLWQHNQGLIADMPWLATTANDAPYPPRKRGRKRSNASAHAAPANGRVMTLAQLNKALEQVDAVAVPLPSPAIKAPATVSKLAPPSQGAKKRKAAW
ncbi:hypothetical protein HaLaN_27237, partial [Haematococcus lacustris]